MRQLNNVPRLLQLIKANADKPKQFRIENKSPEESTVYLYDAIDSFWGVNAQDFVKEFSAITAPVINLRINSPGGDVFDARAMATSIKNHPSKVIAHIDGLAASAATYVALSADEVRMADGGFFMIHNAWTLAFGNSADFIEMASLLDKIDGTIINDYAKKTGKDDATIKDWMAAETWFTAQEALDNGFIDSITQENSAKNSWDLTAYHNAPKVLTESPPAEDHRRNVLERRLNMLLKIAT
jgi:ATP-dependent Clp protease, protease subunit